MILDGDLVACARNLLEERFGDRAGAATALYTLEGNCYSSVSVPCSSAGSSIEPETGAICEAHKRRERVSAVVTVQRLESGGPVIFATPSGASQDRLAAVTEREAEIACHDFRDATQFHVRPYKSLCDSPHSEINLRGNFNAGFAPLASELRDLARTQATPSARCDWPSFLGWAFGHDLVRRNALAAPTPRHYLEPRHPHEVADPALRHVYFAFEAASYHFFQEMFDAHMPALEELGLNDVDMLHLRQGATALRSLFANVIVWVNWHQVIESEAPFVPSLPSRLHHGEPMHLALEQVDGEPPMQELARLLTNRGPGGVAAYLRQRRLFSEQLFPNGTGRCPFDGSALALLHQTGVVIEEMRTNQSLLGPS